MVEQPAHGLREKRAEQDLGVFRELKRKKGMEENYDSDKGGR